jgi:hypothetical protein
MFTNIQQSSHILLSSTVQLMRFELCRRNIKIALKMPYEHAVNLLNIFLICFLFHNYLNRDLKYKLINFISSLYILACSTPARILYRPIASESH